MEAIPNIEEKQNNTSFIIQKPPKWRVHIMRGLFFLNFISLAFDN